MGGRPEAGVCSPGRPGDETPSQRTSRPSSPSLGPTSRPTRLRRRLLCWPLTSETLRRTPGASISRVFTHQQRRCVERFRPPGLVHPVAPRRSSAASELPARLHSRPSRLRAESAERPRPIRKRRLAVPALRAQATWTRLVQFELAAWETTSFLKLPRKGRGLSRQAHEDCTGHHSGLAGHPPRG